MARRQTAQLDLELAEDPPMEPPQPPAPLRRPRGKPDARPRWRDRGRPWLLAGLTVLLVLGAIAAVYRLDQFLASNVRFILPGSPDAHPNLSIRGLEHASSARVAGVFAQDFGRSIYLLPVAERRRALLGIDWVREAVVSRRWPNRVEVRITERVPVAFAMLPQAGVAYYEVALIDEDGVILEPPPRASFALPVLYGLSREQPAAGRRNRVREALEMTREVQAYSGQISEINAADPDNLGITYSVQGRVVRLMLGNQRYLPRLQNFLGHYAEISRRLPGARAFDLRLDDRITALDGAPHGK
jgi:cell division protein FtsQ